MPREYLALHEYLSRRYAANVVLTFNDLEALLGFPLPTEARTETSWWTTAPVSVMQHSDAWTVAGRTASPNLLARTVAFERPV